jgi:hypothetical protein
MTASLPDPGICMVRNHVDDIWECLVEQTLYCPYRLAFGYSLFCRHAERHQLPRG